jgi:hypothetical protein
MAQEGVKEESVRCAVTDRHIETEESRGNWGDTCSRSDGAAGEGFRIRVLRM